MPEVSVIIPTYNCDRYLPEAIASVQQQTFQDWEVIVIDDGSTDETQQAIAPYANSIRYLYQDNQGVAAARNHGIQQAAGEWIAFLDADDFFFPEKLEAQVAVTRAHPGVGMVHSGWRRVNAQGNCLMEVKPWETIPDLTLESWLRWKPVLPSAMLFHREWLVQAGGFDARFPPAEDTELVLRLARMGCPATWLRRVTVGYRQHDQSAMHKGLPQARSLAAVMDAFFRQTDDLPPAIRRQESQIRYHTLVWIAWYLYNSGHSQEMVAYLQQAIPLSPYRGVDMVMHWGDSFEAFARSWGSAIDGTVLVALPEWQALMRSLSGSIDFGK
jgi:glycosyltransferase involved in cell wall biosynthesis